MWHCPRPTGANAASKLTRRRAGSRCQARSARCRMRHISPRRRPRRTDRCPCAGGEARRRGRLSVSGQRGFFLFLFGPGFKDLCGYPLAAESVGFVFFHFYVGVSQTFTVFARAPSLEIWATCGNAGRRRIQRPTPRAQWPRRSRCLSGQKYTCLLSSVRPLLSPHRHYRFGTCAAINPRKHYPKRTQLRMSLTDALFVAFCIQAGFPGQPPS